MKAYLVKTPKIFKLLFKKRLWAFSSKQKIIYLTFDDGPIPEVTPWVLEQLKKHQAKATFFCIGKNIEENPGIFNQIYKEGHAIGNHTQNHLNANLTSSDSYLENVLKAQEVINERIKILGGNKVERENSSIKNEKKPQINQFLFRPPYGKLSSKKAKKLQKKGFQIVMWDVLSADFDSSISKEKCLENVLKNTRKGSIIIFHDSKKAEMNLRYALPKILTHYSNMGYVFKAIP
ncbi:MAG: polysaccharide deacetylase family protein [Flavobacteriaceae bacterium CG_4_8_14_3_um_filter_34_10]|nr:MAG: polysaccharide deacetylase family protein [Flavobacteriaceae bacterium CG2_30_34_30]PIX08684.1 MAG: polysaccharide deacetylase family protein [Flavobacteriaceae bacterium CG_4_8_14_3_um_filter_34_10]